jgi:alpha-mannosidase
MKIVGLLLFGFIFLNTINGQQRKIYLAPDDHTDYMWSADEEGYRKAFLETLDYYIRINDSTANESYPYQSKWNCDGSLWVYEYEKNRTSEQFSKLIDQIRAGKITVPLNTLSELLGIAPLEATIRDMYYAGSLERRYGLDLDLVINMEDQVLPLGLASLWAGSGAKYSWRGVCDCATKVTGLHSRPNEIYWYKGLDDQKILMKWYSLGADNKQLGGYAEARDPQKAIMLCKQLMNSGKYPYHIAGAFGKGWDDVMTKTDEFIKAARSYSDSSCQVIVSDEIDFFKDFEKSYGSVLPSETVSYGSSEWGNNLASLANVSAEIKRSIEKLRTAEGLYTLVVLKDKKFGKGLEGLRERAWMACGQYFDHDWTADGTVVTKKQRADWQRKIAWQLTSYVDTLYNISLKRLGELIPVAGRADESFFVFNQLNWTRSDYCDYPYNGPLKIKVFDAITLEKMPFQFIKKNDMNYLRILAEDVPPLGFRTFKIIKGEGRVNSEKEAIVTDNIIENSHYKIVFSPAGAITSLLDKTDNNHEYILPVNNLYANDLGSAMINSGSNIHIENKGSVSVTLSAESDEPVRHTSKITLFSNNDRIELENIISQNASAEPVSYTFSFNLKRPEIWHEEAGAVLKARQQSDGGHYADSICRLDWIALNHFTDMSDGENGVVLSNSDAYFMKTGNSTIKKLDNVTSQIQILATGQIDAPDLGIVNQDGDSYFRNSFALRTGRNGFSAAESMRFSLEHQNPLTAGRISGKDKIYKSLFSLFLINDPEVFIWSLKPAEEGVDKGIIIRVWNMGNEDKECFLLSTLPIAKGVETTHVETDISEIRPERGMLKLKLGHNRLHTFRIFMN